MQDCEFAVNCVFPLGHAKFLGDHTIDFFLVLLGLMLALAVGLPRTGICDDADPSCGSEQSAVGMALVIHAWPMGNQPDMLTNAKVDLKD